MVPQVKLHGLMWNNLFRTSAWTVKSPIATLCMLIPVLSEATTHHINDSHHGRELYDGQVSKHKIPGYWETYRMGMLACIDGREYRE